ncbi:aminotransferase class V-fold PLP-dependent enzyme [Calidifontibacter sp. DB0510]|uniref:Aminotransferase class V-fold PLP-dependent enzyme n=1 Tax=Metallococcus carri TaxID=1656884 RepID=A0A967B494_9MICO|nr:aminotransferase class V-fold PLP-dependent enzyme [Metallococcus carri]NHN54326.1 aminotransferase class V-fold PLP-dependent enzyme [Metallococcus carri]NOP36834.1 aminotransferase class V-fold PLP-dependent enzyme [Calidifontibacter sp. DB2511S]
MRREYVELFDVDPDRVHLNHGAFGAVPRSVRAVQRTWSDRIERNPLRFMRGPVYAELVAVRARVADFVGVPDGAIALVRNVSEAFGAVVEAVGIREGDEVVVSEHGYPTVAWAVRARGATVRTVSFDLDATDEEIVAAFSAAVGERTRLVCIDDITSPTAIRLPTRAVAEAVAPVPVYVDAAHAAGTTQVDIEGSGATFWATNLHKWCYTPRGTGAFWVAADWRDRVRPAVTSWTAEEGFPASFEFPGTVDFTPFLAIPAGLDFWAEHGGLAIAERSRRMLADAAIELSARLRDLGAPEHPADWPRRTAPTMRVVELPPGWVTQDNRQQRYEQLSDQGIECPPMFFGERSLIRFAGQLYTEPEDYRRLGDALTGPADMTRLAVTTTRPSL